MSIDPNDPAQLSHELTDEECCVGHYDEDGSASCQKCRFCRQWIRPRNFNGLCSARAEEIARAAEEARPIYIVGQGWVSVEDAARLGYNG